MKNIIFISILFFTLKGYSNISVYRNCNLSADTLTCSDRYKLGIELYNLGDYEKAVKHFKKSIELNKKENEKDSTSLANAFWYLGMVTNKTENLNESLDFYDKALRIYKTKYGSNHIILASLYFSKAQIYCKQWNFEKAIVFNKKTLKIAQKNKNTKLVAQTMNDLGFNYFEKRDFKKAEFYFKKSLSFKRENNYTSIHLTYSNLARTYNKLNKPKRATKFYNLAIESLKKKYHRNNVKLAHTYLNYGIFCNENKQKNKALSLYKTAYNLFFQNIGLKHSYTSNCLLRIGDFYFEEGDIDKSLIYYQRALTGVCEKFNNKSYKTNPLLKESIDDIIMLEAFIKKSIALFTYYREGKKKDLRCLILSHKTYALAIKLLHKLHKGFRNIKSKLFLLEIEKDIFYNAVVTATELYKKTNDPKYKELIFNYSEQSKSGTLLSAIRNFEAKDFGKIPKILLEQEYELRRKTEFYKNLIYTEKQKKEADKNKISDIEDKLFDYTNRLDKLIDKFEKEYKAYYNLKYNYSTTSVENIQAEMDSSEIMIEYMLPEINERENESNMFVIIISKDVFQIHTVSIDSDFNEDISSVLSFLKTITPGANYKEMLACYKSAASKLYDKLLKPLENLIKNKKIIVIPDKKLSYIPFDVLLTKMPKQGESDLRYLPYLIKENAISYSYSANLLYHKYFQNSESKKELLALAPSYQSINENSLNDENKKFIRANRDQLTEIPWAKKEVDNISGIFSADVFKNVNATENIFKKFANNYNILHLAMHAVVNNNEPMYSKLVFTQVEDTINDGFLNAYELYNMKLNTQMVVLSACNTGGGEYSNGEGVMSMARAFRYAGVKSIIMTLWSIDDISSSELMTLFYIHLAENKSKDEALRLAKLDYLNSSDTYKAHPYFWAAYVGVGDTCPVSPKTKNDYIFYITIIIITGLLVFLFIRHRKYIET